MCLLLSRHQSPKPFDSDDLKRAAEIILRTRIAAAFIVQRAIKSGSYVQAACIIDHFVNIGAVGAYPGFYGRSYNIRVLYRVTCAK